MGVKFQTYSKSLEDEFRYLKYCSFTWIFTIRERWHCSFAILDGFKFGFYPQGYSIIICFTHGLLHCPLILKIP